MSNPTRKRPLDNSPLWELAITDWTDQLRASNRSPATVTGYRTHAEWLASDMGDDYPDPWTIPTNALARWLDEQNWSQSTRRKVLVSLRSLFAWGINEARCARSPLAGVAAPPARKRGPSRIAPTTRWREPVANFLVALAASARRPSMIEQRRWWLTRLSETYADPWAVTTGDLALWLARDDYAASTKRLGLSSVRTFYAWAEREGHVSRSPARDLSSVRVPRALPRPAPDAAVIEALTVADDRTRLAILIAIYAGLRRAEIACLHARDLHPDHLHVTGKGGNERRVPLHPELATTLRRELSRRQTGTNIGTGWGTTVPHPDGWLFPSDNPSRSISPHHLGKLISSALPYGYTTHTLRHRFATQAYQSERDLRAVQELLGHSKPETTARYAAVPDGALTAAVLGVPVMSPRRAVDL